MLVLSRKAGESICIGGEIKVTVLSVRSNRVRIGFDAPDDVDIVRSTTNVHAHAVWSQRRVLCERCALRITRSQVADKKPANGRRCSFVASSARFTCPRQSLVPAVERRVSLLNEIWSLPPPTFARPLMTCDSG